jgi:hypothetical protein
MFIEEFISLDELSEDVDVDVGDEVAADGAE